MAARPGGWLTLSCIACNSPPSSGRRLQQIYTEFAILEIVLQTIAPTNAIAYQPARRAPSRIEAVGIVIPARNESETIAKCISNIFAAHSHSGWRNSLWIVVVADACTDTTAKVARSAIGAFGEVLEIGARSLQTAHRIGASTVMEHFRHMSRHSVLLTSTCAGAEVRRDWIDTMVYQRLLATLDPSRS
jgi:cellulose synthase/poly-beta-1,6-N-acetylglucosamine synthase-like glycosyltransferase